MSDVLPRLPAGDAALALSVARDVAGRLADRAIVDRAAALTMEQTAYPKSTRWQPYSVAQGYTGLAVLYGYLDACFPGDGWDRTAHGYLTLAARGAEARPALPLGLFAGLAGLSFTAWSLSRDGLRYRALLSALDENLAPMTIATTEAVSRRATSGVAVRRYDAISGLSGVGAYLLCRREPGLAAALRGVLAFLVGLTHDRPYRAGGAENQPYFYTPMRLLALEEQGRNPAGSVNCGLAHGIPGPLAVLSLAYRFDVRVAGIVGAIERLAGYLARHSLHDRWGVNWPLSVAVGSREPREPSRAAWCYGAPGVARALWLAGEALDRADYRTLAVDAMAAVYRRPVRARHIDSPTFCHGVAGLLQITLRFLRDTGLPLFAEASATLSRQLLSAYDHASPLGYRCLEPDGRGVDRPGLLDGAAGVAATLLTAATGVEPAWDRLFLLS